MKKLLITLGLGLCLVANAQVSTNLNNDAGTNVITGPAAKLIDFLVEATNIMVAPYGIVSTDHKFGGGVALAYKVSDFVVPMLRLDYFDGTVWMPSASLQLQAPMTIAGKFTVVPFAFSGIATYLAGKGGDNGNVEGIFGVGAALRLGAKWDIVSDYEIWTHQSGNQIRFGVLYKF